VNSKGNKGVLQDQWTYSRSMRELAPGNRVHLRVVFNELFDHFSDGTSKAVVGYSMHDALGARFGVFRTIGLAKAHAKRWGLELVNAPEGH
jgi:hypothetical protein